ncbi:hypothetical protein GCM10027074_12700 [Streptomyces deserti]
MTARIEHLVTSGTFQLDGGSWEVDNNVWLIGNDDEVLVIDAAHDTDAIAAAVGNRRLVAIVCTPAHNDHVNAALALAARSGAPTLPHPADAVLWKTAHGLTTLTRPASASPSAAPRSTSPASPHSRASATRRSPVGSPPLVIQDQQSVVMGHEPVYVDGRPVGYVTSAAYGYTIGAPIAYAWLPAGHAAPGTPVEIEYFGARIAAVTAAEPLFDPEMSRIRR